MRYVDPSRVEAVLPGDLVVRARDAKLELLTQTDEAGQERVINLHDDVWQEMKKWLKRVMDNKCWYCETRQIRSDNAVDHFRPKSVYWWLAFDYNNYRFACTFCNSRRKDIEFGTSGGKHNEFPLSSTGVRANAPGDDLKLEDPLLIDPCEFEDPPLLWFDDTGQPGINPHKSDSKSVARVKKSITLYHLDHSYLSTARREKYLEIGQLCKDGDREYERYEKDDDQEALERYSALVVRVYRAIERSAEHSAAAMCAVRGKRTTSITAREALDRL